MVSGRCLEVQSGQGQLKSGQVKSGQKSVQIMSRQVKSGLVKTGQVNSGQVKAGQGKTGWDWSSHIRTGQINSGQAKSSWERLSQTGKVTHFYFTRTQIFFGSKTSGSNFYGQHLVGLKKFLTEDCF